MQATYENSDGSGWMMRTPHGIEIVRSAKDIDHVVSSFFEARARWQNGWAVWHSRLATHGHIDDVNTHPFTVPGNGWAMVHNGILPLSDGPWRSDRSDSRILAEDHLSQATWADLRANKAGLEKWLDGDRVVIMSNRREKGGPVIILNEKLGKWDASDDCWYSHSLYWPRYLSKYTDDYVDTTARAALPSVARYLDDDVDGMTDAEYAAWWEAQDMTDADLERLERQSAAESLSDDELRELYGDVWEDF